METVNPPTRTSLLQASEKYQRDGYALLPQVLSSAEVERTVAGMNAVMRGEYETGKKPLDFSGLDTPATKLRKIDQAHVSNRAIFEAITNPELGRLVAAIHGASMVQVWALQLLYKPPGGDPRGSVGWHQDYFYWKSCFTPESNVFTAWLALSDVAEECGPMHFAAGSQRWGLLNAGDFFGAADEQRDKIVVPAGETWREESGAMPAGAFSLHHRLTFHGSQPNVSMVPRYSFAIHLRTEKSTPMPDPKAKETGAYDYVSYLDDPQICPVIYQA
jgi:ectoine hydroxylase-related dioxygenase (phytanoyl-CoA dioxygenase family)